MKSRIDETAIRITWMAGFGIVSAGLLIARMMCKIAIGVEVPQTRQEKIRAMAVELAIGQGPPLVQLIIRKDL